MRGMKAWSSGVGALAVVAAATVGFAVGDALATPGRHAATIGSSSDHRAQSDLEWSWDLAPGKTLEIKGINGWIHVDRARGTKTSVSVEKKARHSDPDEVKIEVVPTAEGITICAVYPGRWGSPNSCESGDGEHSHVDNNDVQVYFTVHVASGVRCVPKTVNGDIEVASVDGPVDARTVNGSIDLSSTKPVSAQTVNGSIRADMGMLGRDDLDFQTVNGSVTVVVGGRVDARLVARTLNGDIDSDWPLTIESGKVSRHRIDATIGRGGPQLRIETVNGGIHLRQRGGPSRDDD